MKQTFILLTFISISVFSQDSRLTEQSWLLNSLIINNQTYTVNTNDINNIIMLGFNTNLFFPGGICVGQGEINYNGSSEFILPFGLLMPPECPRPNAIGELYHNFWHSTPSPPFLYSYEITDNGQDSYLTIINTNGDKAIYGINLLSVKAISNIELKTYPNPVIDILNITNAENLSLKNFEIFDSYGKKVIFQKKNLSQINLKNLTPGIYFIRVKNTKNEILIKKIIKN